MKLNLKTLSNIGIVSFFLFPLFVSCGRNTNPEPISTIPRALSTLCHYYIFACDRCPDGYFYDSLAFPGDCPGHRSIRCTMDTSHRLPDRYASPWLLDWQYYRTSLGEFLTEDTAKASWLACGLQNGLMGIPSFNAQEYLDLYPDLKAAFGSNLVAAADHYRGKGVREGRVGRAILNPAVYKDDYYELFLLLRDEELPVNGGVSPILDSRNHFVTTGSLEGYSGGAGFEPMEYLLRYPDLYARFLNNYVGANFDYIQAGKAAGRLPNIDSSIIETLFDKDFYENTYGRPRVRGYYEQLREWLDTGILNGWRGNYLFDPREYLSTYPDLTAAYGTNYRDAVAHYIQFGNHEGRIGRWGLDPHVFDWQYYLSQYPTLPFSDEKSLTEHWLKFGIAEGRIGHPVFNVKQYLALRPDLQKAYGTDYNEAIGHYVIQGRRNGGFLYSLTAKHSGFNLDVFGNNTDDGGRICQAPPNPTDAQKWAIESVPGESGYFWLTGKHSGYRLDVAGANKDDGGPICQSKPSGADDQKWKIEAIPGEPGYYWLTAKHSGYHLDVFGNNTDAGGRVCQAAPNDTDAQKWKIELL